MPSRQGRLRLWSSGRPWRPRDGLKAAVAKLLHASWRRCRVHFARNALAHAGKNGRRVVAAFIATGVPRPPEAGLGWATAFAQNDADAARLQWRKIADRR